MEKPSQIESYYERLGLQEEAKIEEIKKAYRQKALQYHPDKNPGNEEESKLEFIAISEAYEGLIENQSRYFSKKNFNFYEKKFFNDFGSFEEFKEMYFKYEKNLLNSKSPSINRSAQIISKLLRGGF